MKSRTEDYMEGKGICYLDFTRSELFDLIKRIRQRCETNIQNELRQQQRNKGIRVPK